MNVKILYYFIFHAKSPL